VAPRGSDTFIHVGVGHIISVFKTTALGIALSRGGPICSHTRMYIRGELHHTGILPLRCQPAAVQNRSGRFCRAARRPALSALGTFIKQLLSAARTQRWKVASIVMFPTDRQVTQDGQSFPGDMVRKERLELSRVAPLAPKTSASANSATFATSVDAIVY
jgi:hypothetical protein